MATAVRVGDVTGVIFHTNKGGEYVGDLFNRVCAALGVTQSMGRVGSAQGNAVAESFNSTLEHELLSRQQFATKDQAPREVARFIDAYNHRRRHSSCEMLAPVAYEQLLAECAARAAVEGEAALNGPLRPPLTPSHRSDGITLQANERLHQRSGSLHGSGGSPVRSLEPLCQGRPQTGGCSGWRSSARQWRRS
jgi:Integrase core domain